MARQAGPLYFTGTIDDITFYKMDGTYYARKKSSLDRKRFRTDPRFKRSRQSAARFGEASKLAAQVYQLLPKEQRGKGVVNRLTGQVGRLLKEGKTPDEVIEHFKLQYQPAATKPVTPALEKDKKVKKVHTSTWKITPAGKLIGPKLELSFPMDTVTSCIASFVRNGYHAPQLE